MTDSVQLALIAALAPTLTAIAGIVLSYRNHRKVSSDVQKIHVDINSRLSELLTARGQSERAHGVEEGRALGKQDRQERVIEEERVSDRVTAEQHQRTKVEDPLKVEVTNLDPSPVATKRKKVDDPLQVEVINLLDPPPKATSKGKKGPKQ